MKKLTKERKQLLGHMLRTILLIAVFTVFCFFSTLIYLDKSNAIERHKEAYKIYMVLEVLVFGLFLGMVITLLIAICYFIESWFETEILNKK